MLLQHFLDSSVLPDQAEETVSLGLDVGELLPGHLELLLLPQDRVGEVFRVTVDEGYGSTLRELVL